MFYFKSDFTSPKLDSAFKDHTWDLTKTHRNSPSLWEKYLPTLWANLGQVRKAGQSWRTDGRSVPSAILIQMLPMNRTAQTKSKMMVLVCSYDGKDCMTLEFDSWCYRKVVTIHWLLSCIAPLPHSSFCFCKQEANEKEVSWHSRKHVSGHTLLGLSTFM